MGSFTYFGNYFLVVTFSGSYFGSTFVLTLVDSGSSEDVKSAIARDQGVFSRLKKAWKNKKISLLTPTLEYWKLK